MRYGSIKWTYAEPFARALVEQPAFRAWVLERTCFAPMATGALVLAEQMMDQRSRKAESWWRSHSTERCRCPGCFGQETDLLAVFEARQLRFALHVEVKQPTDDFPTDRDQAESYALRAVCWARSAPQRVLPHAAADTMLLFSEGRRESYAAHIPKFGSAMTFEEAARAFPQVAPKIWSRNDTRGWGLKR